MELKRADLLIRPTRKLEQFIMAKKTDTQQHPVELNPLLNEHEAAKYLGMSVMTMRDWRNKSRGPVYVKLGTAVRYRASDLKAFVEGNLVEVRHAAA